jgi:DNA-binding NarL/FixJ family response regulator
MELQTCGAQAFANGLEPFMSVLDGKTELHALLICRDVPYVGTTLTVLKQAGGVPHTADNAEQALTAISDHKFDVVIVDWRETDDLAEFICAVRHSDLNHDSVLVAIVRDVLDVRQACAAGVHFLIHKPASAVQIERCLRAAFVTSVARRRRTYRAPVQLLATVGTRLIPTLDATLHNLGEGGAALRLHSQQNLPSTRLTVGESVTLAFDLPGTQGALRVMARIMWSTTDGQAGVQFTWMADAERIQLERWLTQRLEHSVAELRSQLAAACA